MTDTSWTKHHWLSRHVTAKDTHCVYICDCVWYKRLWYLVTGR